MSSRIKNVNTKKPEPDPESAPSNTQQLIESKKISTLGKIKIKGPCNIARLINKAIQHQKQPLLFCFRFKDDEVPPGLSKTVYFKTCYSECSPDEIQLKNIERNKFNVTRVCSEISLCVQPPSRTKFAMIEQPEMEKSGQMHKRNCSVETNEFRDRNGFSFKLDSTKICTDLSLHSDETGPKKRHSKAIANKAFNSKPPSSSERCKIMDEEIRKYKEEIYSEKQDKKKSRRYSNPQLFHDDQGYPLLMYETSISQNRCQSARKDESDDDSS